MTTENQPLISVSEMIRTTATNNNEFMNQIADHIDKLEAGIAQLQSRITELESAQDDFK